VEALPSGNPKAVTGAKSWIQAAALMARHNFSGCSAFMVGAGKIPEPAA